MHTYLANKMFAFADSDVDFYLPQIVLMYIQMHDVAEALHPYILGRCRKSVEFSLQTAWLLSAYSIDHVHKPTWKNSQGIKLKNMILNEELKGGSNSNNNNNNNNNRGKKQQQQKNQTLKVPESSASSTTTTMIPPPIPKVLNHVTPSKLKQHQRSRSDATCSLSKGLKFDPVHHRLLLNQLVASSSSSTTNAADIGATSTTTTAPCVTVAGEGGDAQQQQHQQPPPPPNDVTAAGVVVNGIADAALSNGSSASSSAAMTASKRSASSSSLNKQATIGDLASGRAFDSGCSCFGAPETIVMQDLLGQQLQVECTCGAPRIAPQREFIKALMSIGRRLTLQVCLCVLYITVSEGKLLT